MQWRLKYCKCFAFQVDGVVIRNGLNHQDPDDGMMRNSKRSQESGNRYDLMFGIVTGEAIWRFSASDIQNGFEGDRRDKILRTYVRNAYSYHLSEIFYTVSWKISFYLQFLHLSRLINLCEFFFFASSIHRLLMNTQVSVDSIQIEQNT